MTKAFKFKGDPAGYLWDFPLVPGQVYKGSLEAYRRHSVQELIEISERYNDREFLGEWEEVSNDY